MKHPVDNESLPRPGSAASVSRRRRMRALLLTVVASGAFLSVDGAPQLAISLSKFDYGKCGHRQRLTKKATLTNEGDEPLTVTRIKNSCDCTKVSLNGKPIARTGSVRLVIPPKGTAELTCVLTVGTIMGILNKYVEVTSNDPARPTIRLPVLANVHGDVKTFPWRLPRLSAAAGGKPVTQTFTLVWVKKPTGGPLLQNLKAQRANVAVRATPMSAAELSEELTRVRKTQKYVRYTRFYAGYRIGLVITPPAKEGLFSTSLTALLNGRHWEYRVEMNVFKGIITEPAYVQFGQIRNLQEAQKTITLRSADGSSFEIVGVESDAEIFTFEVRSEPGGTTHHLTVKIMGEDDTKRYLSAKIYIRTTHPEKPTVEVRCLGVWYLGRPK